MVTKGGRSMKNVLGEEAHVKKECASELKIEQTSGSVQQCLVLIFQLLSDFCDNTLRYNLSILRFTVYLKVFNISNRHSIESAKLDIPNLCVIRFCIKRFITVTTNHLFMRSSK